jgi:hypothetical protein
LLTSSCLEKFCIFFFLVRATEVLYIFIDNGRACFRQNILFGDEDLMMFVITTLKTHNGGVKLNEIDCFKVSMIDVRIS